MRPWVRDLADIILMSSLVVINAKKVAINMGLRERTFVEFLFRVSARLEKLCVTTLLR